MGTFNLFFSKYMNCISIFLEKFNFKHVSYCFNFTENQSTNYCKAVTYVFLTANVGFLCIHRSSNSEMIPKWNRQIPTTFKSVLFSQTAVLQLSEAALGLNCLLCAFCCLHRISLMRSPSKEATHCQIIFIDFQNLIFKLKEKTVQVFPFQFYGFKFQRHCSNSGTISRNYQSNVIVNILPWKGQQFHPLFVCIHWTTQYTLELPYFSKK